MNCRGVTPWAPLLPLDPGRHSVGAASSARSRGVTPWAPLLPLDPGASLRGRRFFRSIPGRHSVGAPSSARSRGAHGVAPLQNWDTTSYPHALTEIEPEIRRCLLARFPYALIYGIEQQTIVIIAVAHLHRQPGYWADRIE